MKATNSNQQGGTEFWELENNRDQKMKIDVKEKNKRAMGTIKEERYKMIQM